MPGPCCVFCGQIIEEERAPCSENGPVCRACRILALMRNREPGPILDHRQPEAPRFQPEAHARVLPLPLAPRAVLSLF